MIDPVSRYCSLHEQAHPGYGAPPGFDSAVLRQLAAEIRREENEACAKICDVRTTSGGAGYVLIEVAIDIRARMDKP